MSVNPTGAKVIPYPPASIWLLVISIGVVLGYFGLVASGGTDWLRISGVTLLAFLFTLPSYFAAWAMVHTSADLLLYCFMGSGLALGTSLLAMREGWRRSYAQAHTRTGQT